MILMSLRADNLYLFNDFVLDMSYPKKLVKTGIADEYLEGCPNFRYKKVVIIMGANATGKTRLGRLLCNIFLFIKRREYSYIVKSIEDRSKEAYFSIDFAFESKELYRIETRINPRNDGDYDSSDIDVKVNSVDIGPNDSYEKCSEKLSLMDWNSKTNYITELEKVPTLSWMFRYSIDEGSSFSGYQPENEKRYSAILEKVLKILDPRIQKVSRVEDTENTYIAVYKESNRTVVFKDDDVLEKGLSSGTKESIGVAQMIAAMKTGSYHFFFCDEKFSRIHSDSEKAFISLLIDCMQRNDQLFITTHNLEDLDMNLPKHSFVLLKRDNYTDSISCVYPSEYLKRNTDSLKNAVDNDVFGVSPDTDDIFELRDM